MLALIWSAIVARRVPSLVMFVLALFTVAALGLAPWYAQQAQRDSATARIAATPPNQRTLSASVVVALDRDPQTVLRRFQNTADAATDLSVERRTLGTRLAGTLVARPDTADELRRPVELRYRDDLCANVVLDGRCPQALGEFVLSGQLATRYGIQIGDRLTYSAGPAAKDVPLRLVGLFEPREPLGWYWAGAEGMAAYTTVETVAECGGNPRATYDVLVSGAAYTGRESIQRAIDRMQRASIRVTSTATGLEARIAADDRAIERGVLVAALQLFAMCWLAMAVTARFAAEDRRFDIAQLALRGAPRWRVAVAASGQSAVPLLAGVACGAALSRAWDVAALVALTGLGAAAAADWRATRTPVERLLHAVPPRPPRLAVAVLDVCVLALAAASAYQGIVTDAPAGLPLLAPALLALATAIVAARLLLPAVVSAGRSALAGGRLAAGLAALLLARRAAAYRVVPLLAAGGCLFAVAAVDWSDGVVARHTRAEIEVGADRVLTVASGDRERLLSAVRAADPDGSAAMAVVVSADTSGVPVLAVDSTRLRSVSRVATAFDVARLRPPTPAAITFTGESLTLSSSVPATASEPVTVQLTFVVAGTGERTSVRFGPLPGAATAGVPRCRAGCRIVAVELLTGESVTLRELSSGGRPVIAPAQFADPVRWRTALGDVATTVSPAQVDGALLLQQVPSRRIAAPTDGKVYVVDAPVPLPAAVAGGLPEPEVHGTGLVSPFGELAVQIDAIDVPLLPRVGGRGLVVDLEYAQRVAGATPREEVQQVWLATGAPADVVERLRAAGLTVLAEDSVAGADARQSRYGPAAALRFTLAAGVVNLVVAGLALAVVATVQRRVRTDELMALRQQGVPAAALRRAGRWAALAPAAMGVVVAVCTAIAARMVASSPVPAFTDGWPDPPDAVGAAALALAVAAAVITLVFCAVALLSGRVTARRREANGGR